MNKSTLITGFFINIKLLFQKYKTLDLILKIYFYSKLFLVHFDKTFIVIFTVN